MDWDQMQLLYHAITPFPSQIFLFTILTLIFYFFLIFFLFNC